MEQKRTTAADSFQAAFFALISNPAKFRLYLLKNLPAAFFSGLSIREVDTEHCSVIVPFKWFTRNPFRSTYFACMSMAAEMSTGILAMGHIYNRKPAISMLVTSVHGDFYKKATAKTLFICNEGSRIRETIERAIALKVPQTIEVTSSGYNEQNELIATFKITWSFKERNT